MKVLMINGSPHTDGCTARALTEVEKTLAEARIETVTLHVGKHDVRGCIACGKCRELGRCVFDDIVNKAAPIFAECDGMVAGSPVYYAHANGGLLAFMDRLFYSTQFDKRMKVGAVVVSSRRAGSTSAFDDINKYFSISQMPIVTSSYWNEVHGFTAEDVELDLEGLQTMRTLGRNMAFLMRSIEWGRNNLGLPETEVWTPTHFMDGK